MNEHQRLSSKITPAIQARIAQAIERHRKLGESIAIWRDGKVVILEAAQIPKMSVEQQETTAPD
ncbi:hypothetical protein IQ230_19525 [Gloeocapsopsis crepidinum LEGE 06123]|uniref:Uncharacterized protein n=1 Tax=Gloeocapsopsis crepidinum LEGE 06123 TaxID=588587 RepID=A0ABR9UW26_9CHRO|nr:hypothetical protein [Gloeocapsopsis crepidinum]MBE9192499.1 hypothetical protein [Gloeocapsopsis crepidinum LEGE 06123]